MQHNNRLVSSANLLHESGGNGRGSEPRGSSRNGDENITGGQLGKAQLGVGSSSGESADEGEGNLRGPPIAKGAARSYLGYGSSGEESSEEGEGTLVCTDMEESMGESRPSDRRPHIESSGQTRSIRRGRKMKQ